jgi:thymidylate kinase
MPQETLEALDRLIGAPVAVVAPPAPSPVDLLARSEEAELLASWFASHGFIARGRQWARFVGCGSESYRLLPVADWGLPAAELSAMFSEARPLRQLGNLGRLASRHALLVAARRLVEEDRVPTAVVQTLVEGAVAENTAAWTEARAIGPAWGLTRALGLLADWADGYPLSGVQRSRARAELGRTLGQRAGRPRIPGCSAGRAARRGGVVALSGVDGAGKTSQAIALQETLRRLEVDAVVEWTRLAINPSLNLIGLPVKLLLQVRRPARGPGERRAATAPAVDTAAAFRQRHRLINFVWVTIVALANALAQRRSTVQHLRKGRVVIRDRYVLDSAVQLRYAYGDTSPFRLQMWLLRHVSLRPRCAVLLDVTAEEALARKAEQYGLEDLRHHTRLYRDAYPRFAVRRLDGGRPPAELCELIATAVWCSLDDPPRRTGRRG